MRRHQAAIGLVLYSKDDLALLENAIITSQVVNSPRTLLKNF